MDEFTELYFSGIILFGIYEISHVFLKSIKKYIKKLKFLKKIKNENMLYNKGIMHNTENKEYILVNGKTEKLYPRSGDLINKNIILSEGYSRYTEDFKLDVSMLIQPYQNTSFHNFDKSYIYTQKENENSLLKFFKFIFFRKSDVLLDGKEVFVFGKMNKNSWDILDAYKDLYHIKAKAIDTKSFESLISNIHSKSLEKCITYAGFLVMLSIILYYETRGFLIPLFKKLFFTIKHRNLIFCKECNNNPCNLMCEKCENIADYCDNCYVKLQEKINNDEISITEIKCHFCTRTLDKTQKLLYN